MTPYSLVDMQRYMQSYLGEPMFSYQSSRGCPNVCGYCYNAVFNLGRWRGLGTVRRSGLDHVRIVQAHARDGLLKRKQGRGRKKYEQNSDPGFSHGSAS